MPSVAEELAALKKLNLAKTHGSKLETADGLSTPEQEAAKVKPTRKSTYEKEAKQTLNAGTKAVDQDLEFRSKQIAQKKQDQHKKQEASQNLQNFNEAKVKSAAPSPTKAQKPSSSVTPVAAEKKIEAAEKIKSVESVPVVPDDEEEEVPELGEQVPELEQAVGQEVMLPPPQPVQRIPNRAEKKAKKAMEKMGMKPVYGIARVTLKMGGNQGFYTIFQPDVYEKNGSYIVFGETQQGAGIQQQQQAQRAAQMLETPKAAEEEVPELAEPEAGEAVDESGLDAKDIELVVGQAGCSRSKAVAALSANNGDLVNAIMSLTT